MPPFSREALADEEIADIITYLGPQAGVTRACHRAP